MTSVTSILLAVGLAGAQTEAPRSDLRVDALTAGLSAVGEIIDQAYCGATPEDAVAGLFLLIELRIRNERARPVILARQPARPRTLRVARSLEDANAGAFVSEFEGFELYNEVTALTVPKLLLGGLPSPSQFVTLQPGETYAALVESTVMVRRATGPDIAGTVPAGSSFVAQFDVPLWPFRLTSHGELKQAQGRWARLGDIIVGTAKTDFMSFVAPDFERLETCDDPFSRRPAAERSKRP